MCLVWCQDSKAPALTPCPGCSDTRGSHQLLYNPVHPRKAHQCKRKAAELLTTSPESPDAILPVGIKSPSGARSALNTQFPCTQPGVSPPSLQRHREAGVSSGQIHPSAGRKRICLSTCREDMKGKKKKKAYYIPEHLPRSPKVKLRSNFSQEGDVCQTSTNRYLVFIFTY